MYYYLAAKHSKVAVICRNYSIFKPTQKIGFTKNPVCGRSETP